jgi:hypothetical protein
VIPRASNGLGVPQADNQQSAHLSVEAPACPSDPIEMLT